MDLISPQLRAFLAIARDGTVLEGARTLHISQTAATLRIQALETSLGVSLFSRSRRGMALTPEGQVLLRYCKAVDELGAPTLNQLKGLGKVAPVTLNIAGPGSVVRNRAIGALSGVSQIYPELTFRFWISDSANNSLELLKSGRAQLAILEEGAVTADLESKRLKPERYVLAAPTTWRGRPLKDVLRSERAVDYHPEDSLTATYLKRFGLGRWSRPERHFIDSAEGLFQMLVSGFGYSAVTEESVQSYIREKRLFLLNGGKSLEHPIVLAWYSRPSPPPYWREVLNGIR